MLADQRKKKNSDPCTFRSTVKSEKKEKRKDKLFWVFNKAYLNSKNMKNVEVADKKRSFLTEMLSVGNA